jgi:hypothetical protein
MSAAGGARLFGRFLAAVALALAFYYVILGALSLIAKAFPRAQIGATATILAVYLSPLLGGPAMLLALVIFFLIVLKKRSGRGGQRDV